MVNVIIKLFDQVGKHFTVKEKKGNSKTFRSAEETCLISVLGISRGAGTTHLSIMIGNYFANGLGNKTAIVEWNEHNDYQKIRQAAEIDSNTFNKFSYCDIDFYRNMNQQELAQLLLQDYNIVILDMDDKFSFSMEECLRSSCRIIVADMEQWKYSDLYYFLRNHKDLPLDSFQYVSVSYNKETAKMLEREFDISICPIPLERNPFCISGQSLQWFQNMFYVTS